MSISSKEPVFDVALDLDADQAAGPTHVKRFVLFTTSQSGADGDNIDLQFRIRPYTDNDEYDLPGTPLAGTSLQNLVSEMCARPPFTTEGTPRDNGLVEPTPLDMDITQPCYVVLYLHGGYWTFDMKGGKDAIKAKKKPDGDFSHSKKYGKPKGWVCEGGAAREWRATDKVVQVLSIQCDKPGAKPQNGKGDLHPFNYYVRFLGPNGLELPIIIDPNVENRGGNG
ncbi:nucleotide synthetase [Sandarakinorhabdus sp.]|uniref:nucleotide synthetase n=1 Tax=Sandarakinorhabdus sp. TaxID=1916663 RepID=UPI00286E512C|nr:hypothetical protein [Sandarakinorhabdus sp.]